jgi:hypothetical protein
MKKGWSQFIEPAGGIMVLLPRTVALKWEGTSDYARLRLVAEKYCWTNHYLQRQIVIFGGDRTWFAWRILHGESLLIVRVICAANFSLPLRFAEAGKFGPASNVINGVELDSSEYYLVDPTSSAEQSALVPIALQERRYKIETWEISPDLRTELIIHLISPDRISDGCQLTKIKKKQTVS